MVEPFEEISGEFETRIVGIAYHPARPESGVPLRFRRQPENPRDGNAILVLDPHEQAIGYIPRAVAAWLAPLLDKGWIRLGGQITNVPNSPSPRSCAVTLDVDWVAPLDPLTDPVLTADSSGDAAFELVRHGFRLAAAQKSGAMGIVLADWLAPIADACPYPEARLLHALLPRAARRRARRVAHAALAGIVESLINLKLGASMRLGPLAVIPVLGSGDLGGRPAYALFQESVRAGWLQVEEVGANGVVSRLEVSNRGDMPVLIVQGEIVVGLKQNRMVSRTVMVARGGSLLLPVRCVEQGRWRHEESELPEGVPRGPDRIATMPAPPAIECCAPPRVRRASLPRRRATHCDEFVDEQGDVWREVEAALNENEACSASLSLPEAHAAARVRLEESREAFQPPKETIGFLVGHGNAIIGMDLFDSNATLEPFARRILDSYLVQFPRGATSTSPVDERAARAFLALVGGGLGRVDDHPGAGAGLEIQGEGVSGCGLAVDGKLCHLGAIADSC